MLKQKILTLALIINEQKQEILLGLKKRGFGVGKWNGFGGKVDPHETVFQGALRELKEESGISCIDMRFVGLITFEFKGVPELMQVHIFKGEKYEGEVQESEEMKPQWYKINDIPYESMWKDDKFWLPMLLRGECFHGYFLFEGDSVILENRLTEVSGEELREKQKNLINFPLE